MALWNKLVNQTNRRAQGSIYEQQARQYLESQGLKFIEANATFKRKSAKFGSAVESIDYRKQQKWQQAANLWLMKHHQQSLETANCRFDVVAFEGNQPPLWIPNFLG